MSPEHSTSASKHWRVWVGFFFPFWLSLFGFLTSEASHEELEKSNVGGKKKPPRQVLHGTSRDRAGCPASTVSFGNATQLGKLQFPWSGSLQMPAGRDETTNTLLKTRHLCRLSIQTTQSSSKLLAADAVLLWNQEAEETWKKWSRDCPRYVLDAFYPYKNVNDVL